MNEADYDLRCEREDWLNEPPPRFCRCLSCGRQFEDGDSCERCDPEDAEVA